MDLSGQRIHFMGIGGIGVSALAEMALDAGATATGCDRSENDLTRKLAARGIRVFIGHSPDHLAGVDLLVHSAAVPPEHPERLAAGIRQEKRGRFLARFMADRQSVGISGTHGKTTTSWLTAHLLIHCGLDPAVFIGGIAPDLPDGNFRLGHGPFVAELDESDASLLLPRLDLAVITNIESDHLSHYRSDAALLDAFKQYADGVAEKGLLISGMDNATSAGIFAMHQGKKISFGFDAAADVIAAAVQQSADGCSFAVARKGEALGRFSLALSGRHNIQNALAALTVALELGADVEALRAALPLARGVGRRQELLGVVEGADLYSDYAHHPTEVAATIAALRARYGGGILAVFQPHLFSRTRDYADAFGVALAAADASIILDVYPAREEPIPGVDARLLVDAVRRADPGADVAGPLPLADVADQVAMRAGNYAAVVMMGAGDIDGAARELAAREKAT